MEKRALKKVKKEKVRKVKTEVPEVTKEKRTVKDRLTKAGAAVLAVSLAVNVAGVLLSSDEPTGSELNAALTPSYVVEESVDMAPSADDATVNDQEDEEKKQKKISAYSVFVYLFGSILSFAASLTLKLLTPLAMTVLGWVIFAAAVFLAIIIGLKKAFPDVPLRELLTGKNVFAILIFIAAIIVLCTLFDHYYHQYVIYIKLFAFVCGLILVVSEYTHIRDKYFARWTLKKA